MQRTQVKQLTFDGIFLGIMVILTFTPQLGFIPLFSLSATILHIPVLIGATIFGWKRGGIYGLMFGLLSLIKAATIPDTPTDPFFVNPLISVLPRIVFGLLAGLIAHPLFNSIKKTKSSLLLGVVSFLMTVVHTILVLGMFNLFHGEYWGFFLVILGTNGMVEAGLAAFIVPLVVLGLKPILKTPVKRKNDQIKNNNNLK